MSDIDRETLVRLYWYEGRGTPAIADILGVHTGVVKGTMADYRIPVRHDMRVRARIAGLVRSIGQVREPRNKKRREILERRLERILAEEREKCGVSL